MTIRLADFELVERIGRGATAEVWRGEHRRLGLPVAVKVLHTGTSVGDPDALFGTELRAVASLDHRGIAMLFDHGVVDCERPPTLRAGAPYLVTELASGGTLAEVPLPLPWPRVHALTCALLDALAHAHARGVVHKDLKPANVLLCTRDDIRPGPKLVDFGIAHALDRDDRAELIDTRIAGSPGYMAPEQFRGEWREFGPWTDLYALGCVVYELLVGRRPYPGQRIGELSVAHQTAALPELPAGLDAPDGLEAWLHALLAKDPRDRFERAADALWALCGFAGRASVALDSPTAGGAPAGGDRVVESLLPLGNTLRTLQSLAEQTAATGGPARTRENEASPAAGVVLHTATMDDPTRAADETLFDRFVGGQVGHGRVVEIPPMPERWHDGAQAEHRVIGAALGLVGVRDAPFVGRFEERDRLWDALRAVRDHGSPRVFVVRGPAGSGKTRLARWVCRHAEEVGAAHVLAAPHRQDRAASAGLARMAAAELGCLGLDGPGVRARLKRLRALGRIDGPAEEDVLFGLLAAGAGEAPAPQAPHRHGVLTRLAARRAAGRPVIAWIDDAQWADDALEWIRSVLAHDGGRASLPLLFVVTVRDDAPGLGSSTIEALEALERDARTEVVRLGPLTAGEQVRLVEGLLGVDRALASRIAERTAGNPLFAVELVSDWVDRGVLVAGPSGFVLEGGEPELPDDLHEVWMSRVELDVGGGASNVAVALEVAAALGLEVDPGEWVDGCRRRGVHVGPRLIDRLVASRLIERTPAGWSFSHAMLRESLERRARDADRWIDHNAACAAMLEARYPLGSPGRAARLARHLAAAGDAERALREHHAGALEAERASDYIAAHTQLVGAEACLDALGRGPDDRDRAATAVARARTYAAQRDDDAARPLAARALAVATRRGWEDIAAAAHEQLGALARLRSELAQAREHLEHARRGYEVTRDRSGLARTLRMLACVEILRGSRERARQLVEHAQRLFEADGDRLGGAWCLRTCGDIARLEGALDTAEAHFSAARDVFAAVGHTSGVSECVHGLGEILRRRGRLDEAATEYERSIALDRSVGAREPIIPTLDLGLCELSRARYDEARRLLDRALRAFSRQGQPGNASVAHACLLPAVVGCDDLDAFDHHLEAAESGLRETGLVDPDIADAAAQAFELLAELGDVTRGRRALELARTQYVSLGAVDRVRELDERLRAALSFDTLPANERRAALRPTAQLAPIGPAEPGSEDP